MGGLLLAIATIGGLFYLYRDADYSHIEEKSNKIISIFEKFAIVFIIIVVIMCFPIGLFVK